MRPLRAKQVRRSEGVNAHGGAFSKKDGPEAAGRDAGRRRATPISRCYVIPYRIGN